MTRQTRYGLTRRQLEVADCIARANADKQTARELGIAVKTVRVVVGSITARWGIDRSRNIRVQIARRMWEIETRAEA